MNDVLMLPFDWLVLSVIALAYFLPTVIGAVRGVPYLPRLFMLNVLFAWTFFAWAALMFFATYRIPAAELGVR